MDDVNGDVTRRALDEVLVEVQASANGDLGPRIAVPEAFERRAAEIADSVAAVAERFRARLTERLREGSGATDEPEAQGRTPVPVADPDAPEWGLEEVELRFDLSLQAEGGVLIKATAGGTFSVRLAWKTRHAG
ncbi:hypothetical protein [Streptomyces sp. NBC_00557]|uniref:hypothetical protein n=1 Tax=Streptomyces sp. NBC_00557 TaxID=2975776 RepID=UPI002E81C654|nr:hypothetical protein [Streptomyces sp. NBC_00557]WUC39430.1 hypothetical protein OG956_37095 [Streptomyces sp. NBC_00557]